MIRYARRTEYFNNDPEMFWMRLPDTVTYDRIKFIEWVFEVNGVVYTHCIPGFKEEFEKARAWNLLLSRK